MDASGSVVPWELLGEETKLSGFRPVVLRRYRMSSGEESDWDILAGGRTVAVVAVTDEDRVVLVRQFRPGPGGVLLELPGGNVGAEESVESAMARELLEETGYKAESLALAGRTWLAAYAQRCRHTVVARGCRKVAESTPDREEFLEPVELPMSEFVAHVLSGEMTDQEIALRGLVALGVLTATL
ncbi:NUDIX hydrolase [Nocardia takedensis]